MPKRFVYIAVTLALLATGAGCRSIALPGNPNPGLPNMDKVELLTVKGKERTAYGALRPGKEKLMVFFHGNGTSMQDLQFFGKKLGGFYSLLFVEYPGYGLASDYTPGEDEIYEDSILLIKEAHQKTGIGPERTVLFGRSLGAAVALAMAKEKLGSRVILMSPFTNIIDVADGFVFPGLPWLLMPDSFDNMAVCKEISQPVLIVHGDKDSLVPLEMGEELNTCLPDSRLTKIPGAGHNDIFNIIQSKHWNEMITFSKP